MRITKDKSKWEILLYVIMSVSIILYLQYNLPLRTYPQIFQKLLTQTLQSMNR